MLQTGCKQVVYPVENLEPQHSYTHPSCVCMWHIPVICKDGFLKKLLLLCYLFNTDNTLFWGNVDSSRRCGYIKYNVSQA